MTRGVHNLLVVAFVCAHIGACGGGESAESISATTIPPGTPLATIERRLDELGGSYLITRSQHCASGEGDAPAVVAVMDGGRSLMNRSSGGTVIICLDHNRNALRVINAPLP